MAEIDVELIALGIRSSDFRQVDFRRHLQDTAEGSILRDGVPLLIEELAGFAADVDVPPGLDVLVDLDAAGLGAPLELCRLGRVSAS